MVGQGCGAGPDDAAAAADEGGAGGGVVRRAERWVGKQRAVGGQHPGDRVDGGHFERGGRVEPGQQGGQPFGEHGLARARRAEQQQVMAAGRAELRGPPGGRLAEDVG